MDDVCTVTHSTRLRNPRLLIYRPLADGPMQVATPASSAEQAHVLPLSSSRSLLAIAYSEESCSP